MKENYTKPLLAVELFSLTQTVVRDCTTANLKPERFNMGDPDNCGWDMGGGMIAFVSEKACNVNGENMGLGCYNNPSEDMYIFRS